MIVGMSAPSAFTTRPELLGTFGMVASTHWLASAAGMSVLERGGNAFDAAVCAGFVLQVVEPHLNGPGGELPVVLYSAERDAVLVVCGQGTAPEAATVERFRELGLDMVPGTGLLAACVPGAFGAWLLLLQEFGTMRLRDVLEPAIEYAGGGFPLVPRICEAIASVEHLFRAEWPESAAVWLERGVPAPGTRFRNRALAETYARVLKEAEAAGGGREAEIEAARRAWYEGFVAEAIDRFARTAERMDVSGRRHRGLITAQDMATWRATLEAPVSRDYGRYRVFKAGPWSQGPVFLQQLALLEGFGLRAMGVRSADFIHTVVEAAKLAFADREAYYGDVEDVPLEALLDPGYAADRRRLVGETASRELRPGRAGGREPLVPWPFGVAAAPGDLAGAGDPTLGPRDGTRGDTCHVDVVDRWGNLVACTPSGGWLQSSPAVPGLGWCLGTRAQIFNLHPGHPNALAPRKRPRTTLSPSLAYRDGEPWMAFGTPGADQQDQWSLNFFVTLVNSDLNLQEAIDAPMWHTEAFPRSFYPHESAPASLVVEDRLPPEVVSELRRRGHEVTLSGAWSLGRLSAVARDPGRGLLRAAANPRGMQGYAVGR
jgi:gamma-glutamyltranspeptidase/glutathione hydrolase